MLTSISSVKCEPSVIVTVRDSCKRSNHTNCEDYETIHLQLVRI